MDREGAMFIVSIMVACEAFELTVPYKLLTMLVGFAVLIFRRLVMPCTEFFQSVEDKPVLVTGCDTGFGNELARYLDSNGVPVFAGCLHSQGEGAKKLREKCSNKLKILQMDVTSDQEVANAVQQVTKAVKGGKGLWGIVNNAGLNFNGDIELVTMAQNNKVWQINYLGMVRVTKAFLPMLRASKGRVVNVTSVRGQVYSPYTGAYTSSKYAAEAFSDILRQEMSPWGVKVAIIQPCNFGGATGCLEMNRINREFKDMWDDMSPNVREEYGKKYIDTHLSRLKNSIPSASFNLLPVIEGMFHSLFSLRPDTRYLIPGSSGRYELFRWLLFVSPFLPTRMYDWLLMWCFSPKQLEPAALSL